MPSKIKSKDRDRRGRFAKGCQPGPGRPPLALEIDRLCPKREQGKFIRWLKHIAPHPGKFTDQERELIIAAAMVLVKHGAPMISVLTCRALIEMDATNS